jgi:hypothetical protein
MLFVFRVSMAFFTCSSMIFTILNSYVLETS